MAKRKIGSRIEVYNNDSDEAIKVTNLYKSFRLPTEKAFGLKQAIFNRLRGIKGFRDQEVLKGIDLTIKKGEFIGIVGFGITYDIKQIAVMKPADGFLS